MTASLLAWTSMRAARQKRTFSVVSKTLERHRRPERISWLVWTMAMVMQEQEQSNVQHLNIWTLMLLRLVLLGLRGNSFCSRLTPIMKLTKTKSVDFQHCSLMTKNHGAVTGRQLSKPFAMPVSNVLAICLHPQPLPQCQFLRLNHLQLLDQCQFPRHQHRDQRVIALMRALKQSAARPPCMGHLASGARVGPCVGTQRMIAQQEWWQFKDHYSRSNWMLEARGFNLSIDLSVAIKELEVMIIDFTSLI